MNKILVLYFSLCLALLACGTTKVSSQTQGIKGKVLWVEGNQMPGPGRERPEGKAVSREVVIYDVLKTTDLKQQDALFSEPTIKPVAVVKTNEQGEFEATLPEGVYSVLTREDDGLFANSFDGENNLMPVKVESGQFTVIKITINYRAVY